MTDRKSPNTKKALRIVAFANFFKSYMSVATILAACLPIPVASLRLIPMYTAQRGYLTVYASLFCFLLLSFVFSVRHKLSVWMFLNAEHGWRIQLLPLAFMILTMICIFAYHGILGTSVQEIQTHGVMAPTSEILAKMQYTEVPHQLALAAAYLGMFIFAEVAFVLMALREYLQDVLGLDEILMLHGKSGFTNFSRESGSASRDTTTIV